MTEITAAARRPLAAPDAVDVGCSVLQRGRNLQLDGLRSVAIFMVISYHCVQERAGFGWFTPIAESGWMGVDLFFVLSGFLITGILINTVDAPNYYRRFIARRTLRVFPLFYACLGLFTAAVYLSPPSWKALFQWGGPVWFCFYPGNIRTAWIGQYPPVFSFGPLWSLQVEEQFYLLYPIMVLLLSRRSLKRFLFSCVVLAPSIRAVLVFTAHSNRFADQPVR